MLSLDGDIIDEFHSRLAEQALEQFQSMASVLQKLVSDGDSTGISKHRTDCNFKMADGEEINFTVSTHVFPTKTKTRLDPNEVHDIVADHEKDCAGGCIFCASKCPKCRSTKVRVRFGVAFEYENSLTNNLEIATEETGCELECLACGERFEDSEWHKDHALKKLIKNFSRALNLQDKLYVEIDDDGKVTFVDMFTAEE